MLVFTVELGVAMSESRGIVRICLKGKYNYVCVRGNTMCCLDSSHQCITVLTPTNISGVEQFDDSNSE